MKHSRISEILTEFFRWIDPQDSDALGAILAAHLEHEVETRARARTSARLLTNWGLPITGDLLRAMVGGSKTMISAVMRETYLENARQAAAGPNQAAASQVTNNSAEQAEAFGRLGHVEKQLDGISTNVEYLVRQLNWIHRSIDTERQLAKLLADRQMEPLTKQATEPPRLRQHVISTLMDDMQRARMDPSAKLHSTLVPPEIDPFE